MRYAIFFIAILAGTTLHADDLPIVPEHMDEVWLVKYREEDFTRVWFIRHDIIQATRGAWWLENALWTVSPDGKFMLCWDEYDCHRRVTYDVLQQMELPGEHPTDKGPWWVQAVKDLKAPPPKWIEVE